jgi:putative ABC transport system ATP-binding protein
LNLLDTSAVASSPDSASSPGSASSPVPAVELRGVFRGFDEGGQRRLVLEGADLRVEAGAFVALLGPSGSGKSTLLNLMAGIDAPDQGEVLVDGVALHTLNERGRTLFRRERIGFVFQAFNLIPTLTVEENLLLPLELAGKTTEADRVRARDLLHQVGLGDRGPSWPDRLSGGEQQRVAVARALAHAPGIILADEPTGNLDPVAGEGVLNLLESLVRAHGTTLVLVTHSEAAAQRADRILEIRRGLVVERPPSRSPA